MFSITPDATSCSPRWAIGRAVSQSRIVTPGSRHLERGLDLDRGVERQRRDADGKLVAKGQLGGAVSIEEGQKAARACALNLLAQIKAALGDLDKVVRVVRLGGFVNSAPDFLDGPKVLNGASDLMVAAFGDKGRHARTTVGVASLPADAAVEVEGIFEVS